MNKKIIKALFVLYYCRDLQVLEVPGSCVSFVSDELPGELLLTHGARSVGTHVERDLGGSESERVEQGLSQILLAILEGREGKKANGLDLVGFVGDHAGSPVNGVRTLRFRLSIGSVLKAKQVGHESHEDRASLDDLQKCLHFSLDHLP